jgi:hypothetical protein
MAKYFLLVKIFSRGRGSRVTRAAAYRAGERIRDERTGESYNHSDRHDIVHTEIILPSGLASRPDMEWARDRATLWNTVEGASDRRNSRLAREVLVILPPELTPVQRTNLVRTFSQELAEKYRSAVDFAVHEPRPGGDPRHHHAHVLMTTREVTPEGLGPRTTLDLSGTERHARGLGPSKGDLLLIRERWAQLTNDALLEAGIRERVDHRSYLAQDLDRDPAVAMPQKVYYAERKYGRSTSAGDEIRARHRERVEARLKGREELARVLRKQKEEGRQRTILAQKERERLPKEIRHAALTRDELNQLRRQGYQANKEVLNQKRREKSRETIQVDGQAKSRLEIRREKRREQHRALSEEERERTREKARLQYHARVAATKARALSATQAPKVSTSPTAEESVKNWLAYRESHSRGPTPEESVKNWLAYRERQQQAGRAESQSNDRAGKQEEKDGEEVERDNKRDRDHDRSL